MKLLILLFLFTSIGNAQTNLCDSSFDLSANMQDFNNIQNQLLLKNAAKYYMYFEAAGLEDLQDLKNCLDYVMCGKYQESIVDDPKNYRMHIWKSMTTDQIAQFVRSCPIKNLASKLIVKQENQFGKVVDIKNITPHFFSQIALLKRASPTFYHHVSEATAKLTMNKVTHLLKTNQVKAANQIILSTWGIELHGYHISYTGAPGAFATTNHQAKEISFGKDWIKQPCDFIRMIRHEAEHVAQMNRANQCGQHNFEDHENRERAAYLNDVRFMQNVCRGTVAGELIQNTCLGRFRKKYMKL